MDTNVIQHRINRINFLLSRLDCIPRELDNIHEELFTPGLHRKRFTDLVTRRQNLLTEQENKERELTEVYRIIDSEEDF